MALHGCGGGGASAGSPIPSEAVTQPVGPASSLAIGPITGFGSVIVNGVRYDDRQAVIASEDQEVFDRSSLGLGMHATVEGTVHPDGTTGVARSIRVRSELQGPVSAIVLASSEFTVMGVQVLVDSSTALQGFGRLAELVPGASVEVHGVRVNAATVRATRVERRTPGAVSSARGAVAALNPSARTFVLNGTVVDYSGVNQPLALADGVMVKVRGTLNATTGKLVATSVRLSDDHRAIVEARASTATGAQPHTEIRGAITAYNGLSSFQVAGIPVDASAATFRHGSAAQLAITTLVEVKGRWVQGTLVATSIELENRATAGERLELKGLIESFAGPARFKVNGIAVNAQGARYERGSAASLMNGALVEVKGQYAGDVLTATRVEFQ